LEADLQDDAKAFASEYFDALSEALGSVSQFVQVKRHLEPSSKWCSDQRLAMAQALIDGHSSMYRPKPIQPISIEERLANAGLAPLDDMLDIGSMQISQPPPPTIEDFKKEGRNVNQVSTHRQTASDLYFTKSPFEPDIVPSVSFAPIPGANVL
jgi:hypothetical protein